MALNAVAVDKRVKAVVASTMYDMTRVMSKGYNDSVTLEQRTQTLEQLSRQRWKDAEKGNAGLPAALQRAARVARRSSWSTTTTTTGRRAATIRERSTPATPGRVTTPLSFMNMPILTYIKEISPRPILLIHGEKAHSRYFSETAYAAAAEPKELVIIPGAIHVDLYDQNGQDPLRQADGLLQAAPRGYAGGMMRSSAPVSAMS